MCRSIKILRPPYAAGTTDEDVHAAALQYVQTVSGFRHPAGPAADAFNQAVADVTAVTASLLARLEAVTADPVGLASQHPLPQPVPGQPVAAQPVTGQAGPAQPAPAYAQPGQPPGQAGIPGWPPQPPPGPSHYQPR